MTKRFDDRLRQLEARAAMRTNYRAFAELDQSTEHGRRVANIFRCAQERRQPMTVAEAGHLATKMEEFVAAVDHLDSYTDDDAPHCTTP